MQSVYFHEEHSHHLWSGLPKANGSNCWGVWIYKLLSKLASGLVTSCIIASCVWSGCYLIEGELYIGLSECLNNLKQHTELDTLWHENYQINIHWIYREISAQKSMIHVLPLTWNVIYLSRLFRCNLYQDLNLLVPFHITTQCKRLDE